MPFEQTLGFRFRSFCVPPRLKAAKAAKAPKAKPSCRSLILGVSSREAVFVGHAVRDAGEPRVREWRHAERDRQSLQESLLRPCRQVHRELNQTASALKTGVCHIRVSNCGERPCGKMCRSKNTEFLRGRGLRAAGRVGEESRKAMNRTVPGSAVSGREGRSRIFVFSQVQWP